MNYLVKSILALLFFIIFIPQVMAADINISCNATACTPASNPALFPDSEVWYPGKTLTKTINLNNISGDPITVNLTNSNNSTTGDLDSVIQFTITRVSTSVNLFDDIIKNYYGTSIALPTLVNGTNEDYSFTAVMSPEAGNEYQNKNTGFDLALNFTVGSPPTPTPTSSPPTDGGGGGTVAGAATVCNDTKPGSAPTLLSAIGGTNSVTLNWSEAKDPVSYYLVAYGVSPSNSTYGNPNVGPKGTTSYTVSGLSGGVTYCFIVRAGNGCTPGDFSNQICTTPGGGFVAGPAPGFTEGVLGEATKAAELTSTPSGQTQGEVAGIKSIKNCSSCFWWPILLGEIIALIIIYWLLIKKYTSKKQVLAGLAIGVVSYIIFLLLNRNCLDSNLFVMSNSIFCKYFYLFDAGILLIITWIWKRAAKEES